jgi:hypothetical protein
MQYRLQHHRVKTASQIQAANPHLKLEDCFKTPCTSAVLGFFGIGKNDFKFCQFVSDMRQIFRDNGWKTIQKRIPAGVKWDSLVGLLGRGFYFVSLEAHVFLIYISDSGKMRVDVDTHDSYKFLHPEVEGVFKIELA